MDTDQGLAIGAIASVLFFGICGCITCFYKDCCARQHSVLKPSRSDLDLENMVAEVDESILENSIPSGSAHRLTRGPGGS